IFVALGRLKIPSSVRSDIVGICRPAGAEDRFGSGFCKDCAPPALVKTVNSEDWPLCDPFAETTEDELFPGRSLTQRSLRPPVKKAQRTFSNVFVPNTAWVTVSYKCPSYKWPMEAPRRCVNTIKILLSWKTRWSTTKPKM